MKKLINGEYVDMTAEEIAMHEKAAMEIPVPTSESDRIAELEEALAMLWLEHQDLKGKTPTELHDLYWAAVKEIRADYAEKRRNGFVFR